MLQCVVRYQRWVSRQAAYLSFPLYNAANGITHNQIPTQHFYLYEQHTMRALSFMNSHYPNQNIITSSKQVCKLSFKKQCLQNVINKGSHFDGLKDDTKYSSDICKCVFKNNLPPLCSVWQRPSSICIRATIITIIFQQSVLCLFFYQKPKKKKSKIRNLLFYLIPRSRHHKY